MPERLPPRLLPLMYFGAAHVALAFACVLVGWSPRAVAGFFYHSWMVAIVHLVTLGWITLSILGSMYIVGPVALRTHMAAGRGDYVAYALVVVGIIGMVAHFWIEEFSGMAWAAGTVLAGVLYVAGRFLAALRSSKTPAAVRLHIVFACLNMAAAGLMGTLLGINKVTPVLPGFVLSNVFAHAHLAAVGWATMMVVGVGYRLLPMILPAKPPEGTALWASAVLLETGVIGLFAALVLQSGWSRLFALLLLAGLAVFGRQAVTMVRTPRPRPPDAPAMDFAVIHAAAAGAWLIAAATLGVVLLFAPASAWALRVALAYGVFGLLGFLSQMVVGMETRLLPMFTWYHAYARSGFKTPPPSPHVMRDRLLQAVVLGAWTFAVPAIAAGFFFDHPPTLAAGAWVLFAGVCVAAVDHAFVLRRAFARAAG